MVAIARGDVEAVREQVDEVAPVAAAGVEHAHAGRDPPAQQLVEQIDVDVAELIFQRWSCERVTDDGAGERLVIE